MVTKSSEIDIYPSYLVNDNYGSMAVNLRKKYYGKSEVSKKNRTYRYQLDFYHNNKRIRETIKEVEFLPSDSKEQRTQKRKDCK